MGVLRRLGRFRQRSRRYTRTAGWLIVPSWHTRPDSSVAAGHSIIASAAGTSSPTTATRASHTYREVNTSGVIALTDIADDNFPVDTIVDANGRVFTGVRNWPSATNLLEYSHDISSWTSVNVTHPASSQASPEPGENMVIIHEDASAAVEHRVQSNSYNITTGSEYCMSGFAKPINRDTFAAWTWENSINHQAKFDMTNLLAEDRNGGYTNTQEIIEVGNGIYFWWFTFTASAEVTAAFPSISVIESYNGPFSFDGQDQDSIYLWGVQAEQAYYPSQLIKTTGSSASRAAGTLIYPATTNISNTQQGTLALEFWHPNFTPSADTTIFQITDGGSTNDRIRFYVDTSGYLNVDIDHTGGTTRTLTYSANVCNDVVHSGHVSYINGRAILAVDGAIRDTNTSIVTADIPNDLDQIEHTESCAVLGDIFFLPYPQFKGGFRYA